MQAIVTKFLGPTNFKGARVKAACEAGQIVVSWDDALNVDENHDAAAHALAHKLGWDVAPYGKLVGGTLPETNWHRCYVFTEGK